MAIAMVIPSLRINKHVELIFEIVLDVSSILTTSTILKLKVNTISSKIIMHKALHHGDDYMFPFKKTWCRTDEYHYSVVAFRWDRVNCTDCLQVKDDNNGDWYRANGATRNK